MNKITRFYIPTCLVLLGIGILLLGAMDMQQASAASQPEVWQPATPIPEPLAADLVQCPDDPGRFYMVGGVQASGATSNTLYRYDIADGNWTEASFLASLPSPRRAPGVVCYQGRIYVAGGRGWEGNLHKTLFIYDIITNTWISGPDLPDEVWGAYMGAWEGKLYIVGGNQIVDPNYTPINRVDVFDLATWEWTASGAAPMPYAASFYASVQDGPDFYAVGGFSGDMNNNVNRTQLFNMATGEWEQGPVLTSARGLGSLAVTDSHLYYLGGDENGGGAFDPTNLVEVLDLSAWPGGTWTNLGDPLNQPNLYPATTCSDILADGEIWAVGGADAGLYPFDTNYYRPTEECAEFYFGDLTREEWELGNHPGGTAHYVIPLVNNGTYTDTYTVSVSSAWVYTASVSVGPVAPGFSGLVMVDIEVPDDAEPGDFDIATLTITSQGDPEASDSAQLTTSVTEWQEADNVPIDISFQTKVQCPDDPNGFYTLGGGTPDLNSISDVYHFDASSDQWEWVTILPRGGGWGYTASCYDGMIYMSSGFVNAIDVYDIATDTWTYYLTPPPRNTYTAAMGVWNGELFIVGGSTNTVDIYNIADEQWRVGAEPMPVIPAAFGYVQAGMYLYVVGGFSGDWVDWNDNLNITLRLNMATEQWEEGPIFTSQRAITSVAITESHLYASGGDLNHGERLDPTGMVEVLDLSLWPGGEWVDIAQPLPYALEANEGGTCTEAMTGGEIWSVGGASGTWLWNGWNIITIDNTYYLPIGESCVHNSVNLSDYPLYGVGLPGQSITHTVSITNTGNITDYYSLTISTLWDGKTSLGGPSPIAPGETIEVVVGIDIPVDAVPGRSGTSTVLVESLRDPNIMDTLTIITNVLQRTVMPLVLKN